MSPHLLLISCIALLCVPIKAQVIPFHIVNLRSISTLDGSRMNVMFGVRNITNTSAIFDWKIPDDKPVLGFKISCQGFSNNPVLNQIHSEDLNQEKADLVEHSLPREARLLRIDHLVPDHNYSCSLLAAELNEQQPELANTWTSMILPIQFSTLSSLPTDTDNSGSVLTLNSRSFRERAALIVLGGGLPVAVIIACVGACVAYRKCDAYRHQRNDSYRKLNKQKLDKTNNKAIAVEYMTKWSQTPHLKSTTDSQVRNGANSYGSKCSASGRYRSPGGKMSYSSASNKIPLGGLSERDLIRHANSNKQYSPFRKDFQSEMSIATRPTSLSSSSSSLSSSRVTVCSSKDFNKKRTLQRAIVILNPELSALVFDRNKSQLQLLRWRVRQLRSRHHNRYSIQRAEARAKKSKSKISRLQRAKAKTTLEQPNTKCQNDFIPSPPQPVSTA